LKKDNKANLQHQDRFNEICKINPKTPSIMNYSKKNRSSFIGLLLLQGALMYSCTMDVNQMDEAIKTPSAERTSAITTIIHPGILNSKANLDLIRSQANVTGSARNLAYDNTVVKYMNENPIPTSFPSTVTVVGSGGTPTEIQFKGDAILAYAVALRWAKTGNSTYASQAISILNGWANNFQKIVPAMDGQTTQAQTYLEAAWAAPSFAAAGEILRHYKPNGNSSGWSASSITKFETFLKLLKTSYIDNVFLTDNRNNWKVSGGYARMAIGIFTNNIADYQAGVNSIIKVFPYVIEADGTMPEHCDRNDCTHFQFSLTGLTYAAEIGRMQGDNTIYTYGSNRLSAGFNYMKDALDDVTRCQSCTPTSPIFPGVEIAYKYYNSSTLKNLRERKPPYGVSNILFLGFTTYTHFNTN
jgi:Alginate lyase